jgi:ADP-ribose pyrophosphatase
VRFFGPFAAVGGLVINDSGQLLLVRRAKTPGKGLLGLPGGFIDAGETVEAALAREVREETSLELASSEYLTSNPNWYVHQGIRAPVIDLFYVCTVTAPDRVVLEESELCEFQWVIPTQKHLDSMAFESNRLAVLEWMETK